MITGLELKSTGLELKRLERPMIEIQVPSPSIKKAEAKVRSEKNM